MPKGYPSQSRLKELFDYNPDTGEFTRLITSSPRGVKGEITKGYLGVQGYYKIQVDNTQYPAHRLVWVWVYGSIPDDMMIDHINRIRADNRLSNLRLVTHAQNQQNKNVNIRNKVGYTGVFWYASKQVWTANITVNNVHIHLGTFKTLEQAVKMRKIAESEYYTHAPVTPELIE